MERNITIKSANVALSAVIHYPEAWNGEEQQRRFPLIVICHGFVGNRIGTNRLFVKAARYFSKQGFMVLRFDYAGCGESEGDYGSSGFDALIHQTRHVLDYALDIEGLSHERVIVLGHSLGGAVALATAAIDKRIKTLVLWAPVAHPFSDIIRITGKEVYEQAVIEGSADYLGYSFTSSFFESLSEHQPLREVKHISGDILLVHGTSDDVVPVDYSFLYQKLFWTRHDGQCDKEIIFQGDHTFSSGLSTTIAFDTTAHWLDNLEKRKRDWNGWMI